MAPTLYRDSGYTLNFLTEDIKRGNIALPDIQRPFVWRDAQVRDLFDSMYRGYPVGTLMFWETGAEVGTKPVGGHEQDRIAKLLIVDGQQRLTSLFAVLTGETVLTQKFEEKHVRIAFRPTDETFEVSDAAIKKNPEFIPDITVLWGKRYKSRVREFMKRLSSSHDQPLDDAAQDELEERIDRVRDLRDFRFQVIEINANADAEQVADIFVRANSKGVMLKQADFIMTLMSIHWEKGRLQLESFCRDAVDPKVAGPSPRNAFIEPSPDQLLRVGVGLAFRRGRLRNVYNVLRGKDLRTGDVSAERRDKQFDELRRAQDEVLDLTNWHEFLKCLLHAGFRRRRMLTSQTALIYTYVLWLIGKRDFKLDLKTLRHVISRWFFMCHTTGRYTNSPESRIESDLGRISALEGGDGAAFCAELDRIVRSTFTRDYWEISLPNRLDTSSARSPVLSAYWAALVLLDAELLLSDLRVRDHLDPSVTAPRSIERHHLFPRAYLATKNITNQRQVNAIANMTLIDWPENASIGATGPKEYWPTMASRLAPDHLKRQTLWHALPVGWEQLDYPNFLEKRRLLIAQVVRTGFERLWKENRLVLPPTLADLLDESESQTLEFKSTARWNVHTERYDKRLEHAIAKTVCGFLNAEGGKLLIGVNDRGGVVGLDADIQTLRRKGTCDGYELFLRQHLDNSLSIQTAGAVRIEFEQAGTKGVCVVSVAASGRPVFCKPLTDGREPREFWVRIGNATKQMYGEDMVNYQAEHWD